MSSPPSAQVGEVATLFGRYLEGRAGGDVSSEASSDAAEDLELPQCKIRRNYNCTKCTFYTQNPRAFLVHTRDAHFVKLKIFDCPHCVYASKHHQKLIRHIKMVHEEVVTRTPKSNSSAKLDVEVPNSTHDDQCMRIEDMLEEVEDCEDMMIEVEEGPDYSMEQVDDIDAVDDLTTEHAAPSNLLKTKNNVKFFTCDKCTYVTHIRARFTKHVKYHSMPMIKCTMCDFRTPYKWNLDRHMKNHGGSGSFHCSMCNFTADIKQSLTVHEMNHHTPPAGQSLSGRRRNRVGASDTVIAEHDAANVALPKDEEGSGDSRSSHSVSVSCRRMYTYVFRAEGPRPAAGRLPPVVSLTSLTCHCYHEQLYRTWIALNIMSYHFFFTLVHVSFTTAIFFFACPLFNSLYLHTNISMNKYVM